MDETVRKDTASNDPTPEGQYMIDKGKDPRITRARLSGPEQVTKDATVAEMAADGTMTVLVKGTNEWVCTPGNENKNRRPTDVPAIPIGPHWMITWPFDAAAKGLPTIVRDKGAWVMFAGHPTVSARLRQPVGRQ